MKEPIRTTQYEATAAHRRKRRNQFILSEKQSKALRRLEQDLDDSHGAVLALEARSIAHDQFACLGPPDGSHLDACNRLTISILGALKRAYAAGITKQEHTA